MLICKKSHAILLQVSKSHKRTLSIFRRKAPDKSEVLLVVGSYRSHSTNYGSWFSQEARSKQASHWSWGSKSKEGSVSKTEPRILRKLEENDIQFYVNVVTGSLGLRSYVRQALCFLWPISSWSGWCTLLGCYPCFSVNGALLEGSLWGKDLKGQMVSVKNAN